jgi:hypothetical protein
MRPARAKDVAHQHIPVGHHRPQHPQRCRRWIRRLFSAHRHVETQPDDDDGCPGGDLGQDSRQLAATDQHVVRPLQACLDAAHFANRVHYGHTRQ